MNKPYGTLQTFWNISSQKSVVFAIPQEQRGCQRTSRAPRVSLTACEYTEEPTKTSGVHQSSSVRQETRCTSSGSWLTATTPNPR